MSEEYEKYLTKRFTKRLSDLSEEIPEKKMVPSLPRSIRDVKPRYLLDAVDILTFIFAALFLVLPLILGSQYNVSYLFGLALLVSLMTRSTLARLATILFTTIYFLLFLLAPLLVESIGYDIQAGEAWNFVFGINTISLVPVVTGTVMAIIAMGSGVVYGAAGSTRYSGTWILGIAFAISIADAIIGYYILDIMEWWLLFLLHLAIYTAAFLIAWGIFYGVVRAIRAGYISAFRGES